MKLKTTMGGRCLQVDDVFIDPDNIEWYQAGKVSHDAMAAHAYKRELANLRKAAEETPRTHERQLVLNLLDVLDRRAAEILAGWLGEDRG